MELHWNQPFNHTQIADQCRGTSSLELLLTCVTLPNFKSNQKKPCATLGKVAGDSGHTAFHGQTGSVGHSSQGHTKQEGAMEMI